jgi:virginiamycin B lyase
MAGQISTIPIPVTAADPNPNPATMATGPDGSLWWTELNDNAIGELTASGVFHSYPIPTAGANETNYAAEGTGNSITVGPDGNIWFVDGNAPKIGRITPDGVITEFPVPSGDHPYAIVTGPDGNLWFTGFDAGRIGVMSTSGVLLHDFAVPRLPGSIYANSTVSLG